MDNRNVGVNGKGQNDDLYFMVMMVNRYLEMENRKYVIKSMIWIAHIWMEMEWHDVTLNNGCV